jgi:hypothetical protein
LLIWKRIWKKNNRRNIVCPISGQHFAGAAWPSGTTGLAGPCRGRDMGAVTTPGSCAQRCDARLPAANRRPVGHAVSTPSTYQERASTGQVELRRDSPKGHGTGKGAEAMTGGNVQLRRQRSGELWWRWRRCGPRAPGRGEG